MLRPLHKSNMDTPDYLDCSKCKKVWYWRYCWLYHLKDDMDPMWKRGHCSCGAPFCSPEVFNLLVVMGGFEDLSFDQFCQLLDL